MHSTTTTHAHAASSPRRSSLLRWLPLAVATVTAGAALALATNDDRDQARSASGAPKPATAYKEPTVDSRAHEWRFNDPRVVKGAQGRTLEGAR